MQTEVTREESRSSEIETLVGVAYDLQQPSRFRLKEGRRAHLYVAEPTTYVPQGEFLYVQDYVRYRLRVDGPIVRKFVYCRLQDYREATRQQERYYRPVRIVELTHLPRPQRPSAGPSRRLTDNELALVERLLPPEFPNRKQLLAGRDQADCVPVGECIRWIGWPGRHVGGLRAQYQKRCIDPNGVLIDVVLETSLGVPSTLVARAVAGGFGTLPSVASLG